MTAPRAPFNRRRFPCAKRSGRLLHARVAVQRVRALALLLAACVVPLGQAAAAGYPERPVTIVSAFPAGGIVDVIARRLAQHFSERFKQSFIVENRAGAAGSIGYSAVARAAPDGYTLVVASGPTTMAPPGAAAPSWQPQTAFSAIGMIGTIPQAIIVSNGLPVRSLPDLVGYAKARPGQVNYGSAGAGTTPFFTMELLKSQQKIDLTHVPYRGQPEVMTDLVRGEIGVTAMTVPLVVQQVQSGKIKAHRRHFEHRGSRRCRTCPPSSNRACPTWPSPTGSP